MSRTIVLGAVAVGFMEVAGILRPPSEPPQAPPPLPKETPTPRPQAMRTVDLEKPGVPVYFDPVLPITISIRALAPSGNYRSRVTGPQFAGGWRPLARPNLNLPPLTETVCLARAQAMTELFDAKTSDEAARLSKAMSEAGATTRCSQIEWIINAALKSLSPEVASYLEAPPQAPSPELAKYFPTGETKLTVERLSDSGVVEKTFEWLILLPVAAPVLTETAWIVQEVAGRMSVLARGPSELVARSGTGPSVFEVTGAGPTPVVVDVSKGAWDVTAYSSLAAKFGIKGKRDAVTVYSTKMLDALSTPTIETLEAVNRELALALSSDALDANTHEASALLLTSVALRASRAGLEDIRPLLNRAVAHLAIAAQASGSASSLEGEFAVVALDLLAGRQVAAAARLDGLKPRLRSEPAHAWYRALMMRATGDWRFHKESGETTLLEKVEYVRALSRSWSEGRAAAYRRKQTGQLESVSWGRAIRRDVATSVELGHEIAEAQVGLEMREADYLAKHLGAKDTVQWLQTEGRKVDADPISPGLWARLAEASVADSLWKYHEFLTTLPPSNVAMALRAKVAADYPSSPTIQALVSWWAAFSLPGATSKCEDLARWLMEEPFRVSARVFDMAASGCQQKGFPAVGFHVTPWVPPGTLFDFKNRLETRGLFPGAAAADWRPLRAMTFYEPQVLGLSVGGEGRQPAASDYVTFQRERAYSLALLRDWRYVTSQRGDQRQSLEPGRDACKLEVEECLPLVDVLRSLGLVDEAFETANRFFAPNRPVSVASSNDVVWVIDENIRRGRVAAAQNIADRAATTGSQVGLIVQARLTERLGGLDQARRMWEAIDERYDSDAVAGFDFRRSAKEGHASRADLLRALDKLGEPYRLSLPNGETFLGRLVEESWLEELGVARRAEAERMGLRKGDVITRVNGLDIANGTQFWAAVTLTDEPNRRVHGQVRRTLRSNRGSRTVLSRRLRTHRSFALSPSKPVPFQASRSGAVGATRTKHRAGI